LLIIIEVTINLEMDPVPEPAKHVDSIEGPVVTGSGKKAVEDRQPKTNMNVIHYLGCSLKMNY